MDEVSKMNNPKPEAVPEEAPEATVPDNTQVDTSDVSNDVSTNIAPDAPAGAGDGDPATPEEQSGEEGEPEQPAQEPERTYTQAELDARLANQRKGLEAKHAKELRGLQLQMQAATLAPSLGIADAEVVLSQVDPKAVEFGEDGKATNLAELLTAARDRIAAAIMPEISSGLPTNPAGGTGAGVTAIDRVNADWERTRGRKKPGQI